MKTAQVDVGERTTQLLTRFNLSTAAVELAPRLESAGQYKVLGLVLEVLEMEAEAREQRKIARLRRAAQLPPGKTFETLEASTLPAPLMRKLRELARGEFLERAENAPAFGLPGVGKSHAACAIANALIEQGHSVLFRPAYQLVQELLAAKRDLMLPRHLRRLDSFELRQEAWDGEESEGGAIRADSEGIRVRRRDGKGGRAQAGRPPPDGASGTAERRAAGAQVHRARAAGSRAADSFYRRYPGSRPQGAAQAASHRASHLAANQDGDAGVESSGGDDSSVCARAKTRAGMVNPHNVGTATAP